MSVTFLSIKYPAWYLRPGWFGGRCSSLCFYFVLQFPVHIHPNTEEPDPFFWSPLTALGEDYSPSLTISSSGCTRSVLWPEVLLSGHLRDFYPVERPDTYRGQENNQKAAVQIQDDVYQEEP